MTGEERNSIISNEYADFIIEYGGNQGILDLFQGYPIHIMNFAFATLHVPLEDVIGGRLELVTRGFAFIPNVLGLASEESLEASRVDELRNIPALNLRGQGILIGIIDTGIDYTNPVFIREDGSTKIASIWDQNIQTEEGYPFETLFGTEYTAEQINQALQSENPLDVVPSTDEIGHGTMLAAAAAGNEVEDADFAGVAPDAELIVVKLRQAKDNLKAYYLHPLDVVGYSENSVMWGVQYLFQKARQLRRPLAFCIGIGSSLNAHEGFIPLSTQLNIVSNIPGIGVITSAGNEGDRRRHFFSTVDPSVGYSTVELIVGEEEGEFSMQLWGSAPGVFSVDILSPSGEYIPRIAPGLRVRRSITFIFEETIIDISYQLVENISGEQLINFRFQNVNPGLWRFNVYGVGDLPATFHIWLPMGNFITEGTYFLQPDINTTIISPGNAGGPITVTAYNPVNNNLFVGASRGFNRSNEIKPEIAAPGVNYIVPALNNEFTTMTGTGIAAAHTTGVAALMLEWGVVRGNYSRLNTVEMKKFIIRGARRSATLTYPNRDWGYGILDVFNIFDVLRFDVGAI